MAVNNTIGLNIELPIYNSDGTAFHNLVLHKSTYDSIVMSLSDKITGDVYYPNNQLSVTMQEYVELDGVKFVLVNPPTVVREGMVSDNSQLNGMTKYSFVFYHPMYLLNNFPFTDVAVTSDQTKYLSESKKFSWIGYPDDFIAKLNKNLVGTEWIVEKSDRFPSYLDDQLSEVLPFDENTIADALKTGYDTWGAPYVVGKVDSSEAAYAQGKRFKVIVGLPSNEIYEDVSHQQLEEPFVFQFGQGVGLKNNSRTPRNNKIITRIAGYGSENNIPYGYPQIPWYGDSRWDWTEYEGDTINYDAQGKVTNTPKATAYPLYMGILGGAYVKLIKHPFTRTYLMPSVYFQTLFNKVSPYNPDGTTNTHYNPNTTLIDYYDAVATQQYPYPNEIVASAPSYESHQFEDIKPELGTDIAIVNAWPINDSDLQPAASWDDSIDDDGNYKQGYFKIKLPVLSFDLYACAAITQEMQINMRSGACLGCTFTVQVDWDDYKKNFYGEDGSFSPTAYRDYTKYPDTTQEQVEVILQKESATFGILMPNMYQHPVADDTFVVLGISLPASYISNAEQRLDAEMKSYMLENNVHYFDYPLKFDEAFLRNNAYILQQIKPNSVIRFKYGNDTLQLFVKQLTVKYGEKVLPQYDITLTDNVEVVLNQIGRVADDVEKLGALIAAVRQNYSRSVWAELEKKLSKTQDDTAQGFIRFMKGLQVGGQFVSGLLGEGGVFRKEADGTTYLEADKMYIRMKAIFDTLEVRKYIHSGGNRIASPANCRCVRVEGLDSNGEVTDVTANIVKYRCYFRGSDGDNTITNDFVVGDQAYCHVTNVTNGTLYQHSYWRLVIGKSSEVNDNDEHYIDLSNATSNTINGVAYSGYQSGSDTPLAQDDIVQLGNVNDSTRRGAIIEFVSGANAPSYQIFQDLGNIGSASTIAQKQAAQYSLNNKNFIGLGYDTSTGRAYMNVYGDFRFGSRDDNGSFIKYNAGSGQLDIKAKINAQSTIGSQSLPDYIKDNQNNYNDAWVHTAVEDLQSQIDGEVDSWFYNYLPVASLDSKEPLTNREPYKTWYEADGGGTASEETTERTKHLGDTFYDNSSGYAFRFSLNETTNAFEWILITDSAVVQALANAAKAQETADGKRATFSTWNAWVKNGVNTLKQGDLFIPTTDTTQGGTTYKAKKVYKCTTDATNAFEEVAYTDDSAFNGYINAIINGSGSSGNAAVAAAAQRAITSALGGATVVDGGLLLTSLIAMRKYNGSGSITDVANYTTWAGISGTYHDAETGTGYKGHGIASWYGGAMVDKEVSTSATDYAKSLFRFDGSGYLASGNISWDKNGSITIKNITTLSDSQNTNLLNELATFNNAFSFSTQGQSTTVLSITPNVQFTDLYIGGSSNGYKAATRDWVNNNYISISFFETLFNAINASGTKVSANTTTGIASIKAMFGFWTEKYLSALGQGDDGGGSGATTLAQLNDVTISNLADGQMLVYDLASNHWKNQTISLVTSLANLTDVTLTSLAANQFLKYDGTKWVNATISAYNLPVASSSELGGVKIGYSGTTAKTYAVQLDSNNKAYVAVPWENTIYTLPVATSSALGGIKIGYTTDADNRNYAVQLSSQKAYVNVPWENTTYDAATQSEDGLMSAADKTKLDGIEANANNYSLPLAASGTRGGVKIGYSESGTNYAVKLSSEKMYVSVPWVNTWRNIYLGGTSKVGTGTDTKALNFKAGSNIDIVYAAAGTADGQSGNANYFNIEIKAKNVYDSTTSRTANTVLAAPNGSAGAATFRALVAADIPSLAASKITSGTFDAARIPTLAISKISGLQTALDAKLDKAFFERLFTIHNGDATIAANGTFPTDTTNVSIEAMFGFWTELYLSALGQGEDGSAGVGDVTWALLASNSDERQIALSHLNGTGGVIDTLTGYTTSGKNYAVQKDSNNHLFVNVPWDEGTNTTYKLKLNNVTKGDSTNGVDLGTFYAPTTGGTANYVLIGKGATTTPEWTAQSNLTAGKATNIAGGAAGSIPYQTAAGTTAFLAAGSNGYVLKYNTTTNAPYWASDDNTKNTAGTTNNASKKLFLVGALEQSANPQTYSNVNVYIGTDNCLYSNGVKVLTSHQSLADYTKTADYQTLNFLKGETTIGSYSPTSALDLLFAEGSNIEITVDDETHTITFANTYSYSHPTGGANTTISAANGKVLSAITVNSLGHVTSVSSKTLAATDIPNLNASKITAGTLDSARIPTAAADTKGGIKVGATLAISSEVLNLKSGVITTTGTYRSVTVDTYGRVTAGTNPATISGYGITDAKIADGVITLGSNTITPVTSVAMTVPTGFSVSGTPISKTGTLAVSYASGYEGFTTTLKDKINLLYSLFTREGSGTTADPYVIKANFGLYSDSFISALGQGEDGTSGVGDVTWALLADNSDTRQIALSHFTTALGTLTGYTTSGKNYAVVKDSSNHLYVNVPWTDTSYTLPAATTSALGGIKVGYTTSGKNYKVQLDSSNNAYVNVPWTDNDTKNTAGSTDTSSKIFLIGATSQAANPQTYSHDTAYVGTDGCLYSNSTKVSVEGHTHTTSIAADTGTNQLTLAFGTKYKLSAGGTSYIFTMPSNPNTDHYDWSDITNKPSTYAPSAHTHTYIEAKGNYTFDSSTLPNSFDFGVSAGFVNSNSGFGSYGSVLTVRTYSGGGGSLQLYAPYSNTYGGTHLKARFGNYESSSGNSWTTLKDIAWVSDIPTNNNQLTNGAGYITSSGSCASATKATNDSDGNAINTTYLKLSGGTMTGVLTAKGSQYEDSYSGALNMNNSNIYGLNSIYTADLADSSAEGIHFYRTATTVDTIWVASGVMYFTPNRTLGAAGTSYKVWHEGNDGSGSGLDADKLDGTEKSGLLTAASSSTSTPFSITVGGTTKTISTLYASQLTASRTLWGQSFNGTANVSGNMTGVGNITMAATNGTYIQLGDIRIVYDSTNNALKVVKSDGTTAANFYATGGISALGETSDGQAGVGDVTWVLLADGTDTRQIALSHFTTSLGTLTGYTTSGKNYAVLKDSSNHLYVNVPWEAGSGTVTSVKVGTTSYTPSSGVVSLPAYPSDYYSSTTSRTANTVLAAPNGSAGVASFRALVAADIPNLAASKITSGTIDSARIPTASSTALGGIKVGSTLSISSGVLNLPTSGVTAGTYKRVTVDAYGRVTSGDNTDANDNTWRNVYTGGTSRVGTGTNTKAINFVAGSNVTISYEAAGTSSGQSGSADYFNVKIAATNTTYKSKAAASGGTAVSLVTTGEKYTWNSKAAGDHTHTLGIATDSGTNALTLAASTKYKLTAGGSTFIFTTPPNTTYSAATQSTAGLMSGDDKKKLDGIAASANNYSLPLAASDTRGGVKIGFESAGNNYGIQLSSEKMYVYVPWTDVNVKVNNTNPTSGTWYYPVWYTATSGTGNVNANDGFRYYSLQGTASAIGETYLQIGNSTASGTAGNKRGHLRIYDSTAYYGEFVTTTLGANRTYTFPNASGTIALTSNIPTLAGLMGSTAIGTTKKPIYWTGSAFSAIGYTIEKSVPSDAVFTDHYAWSDITGKPLTLTAATTGFTISGGTTSKTLTVSESYTLGAACAKGVTDNSSSTAVTSTDTNLITGRTLYYAGYVKSSGVTSITLKAGTGISLDTDNTAITSTGTRTITNAGVRATTINGNYLRVNTNGTNADLTIPYATSAGSVAWGNVTGKPLTLTAATTGFTISGGTTSKTLTVGADYTLGAACAKGVTDNSANADVTSTDTNLITGRTLYYQLAKKGYTTNTGTVTSVATGTGLTGGTITTTGTISINSTYQTYISNGNTAYGWGNHADAGYLLKSGGTMTGVLKVATGYGISDASDNGLLVYHPVDWTGVSSSQWGVGSLDSIGVIRTSNNDLIHYRHGYGNSYIIDDTGGTLKGSLTFSYNSRNLRIKTTSESQGIDIPALDEWLLRTDNTNTQLLIGNVGIGLYSPSHKLHVDGNIATSSSNGAFVQIGGARIVWDSSNSALKIVKSDGSSAANLYTTGGLAALGSWSDSSSGGGDVYWSQLTSSSNTTQIASSHLTSALSGYLPKSGGTLSGELSISTAKTMKMVCNSSGTRGLFCVEEDEWIIRCNGSTQTNLMLGDVGIGLWNQSYKLHVGGVCAATSFTNTSDMRLKNRIADTDLQIEQIAYAPSFYYKWNDTKIDTDLHVGTSAQYWKAILPEVVTEAKDDIHTLSMQYGVAALIAAITTAKKVVDHEKRISDLEKECERLRTENEQLALSLASYMENDNVEN